MRKHEAPKNMRLFTGISLPPEPRTRLLSLTHPPAKLTWTPEEKLHITTKFIGDWPECRLAELQQSLAAVKPIGPVVIHIHALHWMSNALCAGVDMSGDLHRATDHALEAIGVPKETRPYRPHVTLARAKRGEALALPQTELDLAPFRAASFHLYLSANGTYTKLSDYPLPT